jgi:hypothetical protein
VANLSRPLKSSPAPQPLGENRVHEPARTRRLDEMTLLREAVGGAVEGAPGQMVLLGDDAGRGRQPIGHGRQHDPLRGARRLPGGLTSGLGGVRALVKHVRDGDRGYSACTTPG